MTVWGAASQSSPNCESCSAVLTVSTLPAERESSFGTLWLRANPWKGETSIEMGAREKHRASISKWKEGAETSKGLSDGGVEFDRRESVAAKEKRGISIFQRISLSQYVTRCLHSYQLDSDSCTNWLKLVSWAGPLIRCVRAHVRVLHCAVSADKRKKNVHLCKCWHPNACALGEKVRKKKLLLCFRMW